MPVQQTSKILAKMRRSLIYPFYQYSGIPDSFKTKTDTLSCQEKKKKKSKAPWSIWLVFISLHIFKVEQVLLCFLQPINSRRGYLNFPTVLAVGSLYLNLEILVLWIDFSDWGEGSWLLSPSYFASPSSISTSVLVSQGLQKLSHILITKVSKKGLCLQIVPLHCTYFVPLIPPVPYWTAVLSATFPPTFNNFSLFLKTQSFEK